MVFFKGDRGILMNLFYGRCWIYESWWHQSPFFIKFNIIHGNITKSCLCIIIFWFYGNQPRPAMFYLFYSTSGNEFTQDLLISGRVSVGSSSMSSIMCSIRCISISWFDLTRSILYVPFYYVDSHTCHSDVTYRTQKNGPFVIFITYLFKKTYQND